MQNQMEKELENEMGTGIIGLIGGNIRVILGFVGLRFKVCGAQFEGFARGS